MGQEKEADAQILILASPPFHEAKTQPELAKLIREGKIAPLPKGYSGGLEKVIRAMLRQNVSSSHNVSEHEQPFQSLTFSRHDSPRTDLRRSTSRL